MLVGRVRLICERLVVGLSVRHLTRFKSVRLLSYFTVTLRLLLRSYTDLPFVTDFAQKGVLLGQACNLAPLHDVATRTPL